MTLHRQSAIPEGPGNAVAGSRKDLEKLLQDRYAAYAAVTEVEFGSPKTQLAPVRRFCDFVLNGTAPNPAIAAPGPPKLRYLRRPGGDLLRGLAVR